MCVCVCGGSTIGYPESVCVVVSLKTSDRCGILVGSGMDWLCVYLEGIT